MARVSELLSVSWMSGGTVRRKRRRFMTVEQHAQSRIPFVVRLSKVLSYSKYQAVLNNGNPAVVT